MRHGKTWSCRERNLWGGGEGLITLQRVERYYYSTILFVCRKKTKVAAEDYFELLVPDSSDKWFTRTRICRSFERKTKREKEKETLETGCSKAKTCKILQACPVPWNVTATDSRVATDTRIFLDKGHVIFAYFHARLRCRERVHQASLCVAEN